MWLSLTRELQFDAQTSPFGTGEINDFASELYLHKPHADFHLRIDILENKYGHFFKSLKVSCHHTNLSQCFPSHFKEKIVTN